MTTDKAKLRLILFYMEQVIRMLEDFAESLDDEPLLEVLPQKTKSLA